MKLAVVPMPIGEANRVVASYHRHNRPTVGALFALGATNGERLVGVAIVGRPIARKLQDGYTAEVNRVCTLPDAPPNTNSFLYGAAWRAARALGYRRCVTYTLQSESGASLRGAGWRIVNEVPGHDGWERSDGERDWQPVYGQDKFRWEVSAPAA